MIKVLQIHPFKVKGSLSSCFTPLSSFPRLVKAGFVVNQVNGADTKTLTRRLRCIRLLRLYAHKPLWPILPYENHEKKNPHRWKSRGPAGVLCQPNWRHRAGLSRLFWGSNERFLWEAVSAGEWGEIRWLPYPLLQATQPLTLTRKPVSALTSKVTVCYTSKMFESAHLFMYVCMYLSLFVCTFLKVCVCGVIASESPALWWSLPDL